MVFFAFHCYRSSCVLTALTDGLSEVLLCTVVRFSNLAIKNAFLNTVNLFKCKNLEVFDLIRLSIGVWMNWFGNLLAEFRVKNLVLKVLSCFSETVGKSYFCYLRECHEDGELTFSFLRARFIKKFESFRCIKIQQAFDFKYSNDGQLADFVDRKLALLRYAFPDMAEIDLISSTIAGTNDRQLISDFSQPISDLSAFKSKVEVYCQFYVPPNSGEASVLAGFESEPIPECSNIARVTARDDGVSHSLYKLLKNYFVKK